jgi:prepilin-type N-terminal cleavage/methylation domain-containing protein
MAVLKRITSSLRHNSEGMSLIEVIVALGILGLVAITFLTGVSTALKAASLADERATAQSLAQSQMEYVKSCPYDSANNPPEYGLDADLPVPDGYTIEVAAERMDPKADGTGNDDGIQKVSVTVRNHGDLVLTLEDYKVDR